MNQVVQKLARNINLFYFSVAKKQKMELTLRTPYCSYLILFSHFTLQF